MSDDVVAVGTVKWGEVFHITLDMAEYQERMYDYWLGANSLKDKKKRDAAGSEERKGEIAEAIMEKPPFWTVKNQIVKNQAETTKAVPVPKEEEKWEVENQKAYIKSLLKNDIYEPGMVTELQLFLEKRLEGEQEKTQFVLQEIYLENFVNTPVFVNLLQMISQIDYKLIAPAGPIMALAATRHEDCEVREYGLRCYENWEDSDCLPILKELHFEERWLQNYLDLLILDFEEED